MEEHSTAVDVPVETATETIHHCGPGRSTAATPVEPGSGIAPTDSPPGLESAVDHLSRLIGAPSVDGGDRA